MLSQNAIMPSLNYVRIRHRRLTVYDDCYAVEGAWFIKLILTYYLQISFITHLFVKYKKAKNAIFTSVLFIY